MEVEPTQSFRVAVRSRPPTQYELACSTEVVGQVHTPTNEILLKNPKNLKEPIKSFKVDKAFDSTATQDEVYSSAAAPIVESVLEGYNGTIFSYGACGAGKTYTMVGSLEVPEQKGIIPRAIDHIFGAIQAVTDKEFSVSVTGLQIYKEEVYDLFTKEPNRKLEVRQSTKTDRFYVPELINYEVKNNAQMYKLLRKGSSNRNLGVAKMMNAASTRSQMLIKITIKTTETNANGEKQVRTSSLNLVDLTGLERLGRTGAIGETARVGMINNQTIITLGNVITALSEKKKHIPYRDSKLTRLLKDSLGGNTKALFMAHISMAPFVYDETISTLSLVKKLKNVKNNAFVNPYVQELRPPTLEEEFARYKNRSLSPPVRSVSPDVGMMAPPRTVRPVTARPEIEEIIVPSVLAVGEEMKTSEPVVRVQSAYGLTREVPRTKATKATKPLGVAPKKAL